MRLSDRVAPAPRRLRPWNATRPAQRVVRSWLRLSWLPLFVRVYAARKYESESCPVLPPPRVFAAPFSSGLIRIETVSPHVALRLNVWGAASVPWLPRVPLQPVGGPPCPRAPLARIHARHRGGSVIRASMPSPFGVVYWLPPPVPFRKTSSFPDPCRKASCPSSVAASCRGSALRPRPQIAPQKCGTAVYACTLPPEKHPAAGNLRGDSPLTPRTTIATTAYGIAGFSPGRAYSMQHDPGFVYWY